MAELFIGFPIYPGNMEYDMVGNSIRECFKVNVPKHLLHKEKVQTASLTLWGSLNIGYSIICIQLSIVEYDAFSSIVD